MSKNFSNNKVFPAIIFSCLWSVFSFSQNLNPVFQHFTVKDGLPSSEVYSVLQDSKGYLWFATDNGISRFDGEKFKNYAMRDGLTDNVIFKIFEDKEGKIWFGTFSCRLCYFFNDSIFPFEHNEKLGQKLPANPVLTSFLVDDNGDVYLGLIAYGCFIIRKGGAVENLYPDTLPYGSGHACYYIHEIGSSVLTFCSKALPGGNREEIFLSKEKKLLKSSFELDIMAITRSNLCGLLSRRRNKYITLSSSIITVDKNGQETLTKKGNEIISLMEDRNAELWIGYYKGGVGGLEEEKNSFSFLKDLSVSSIIQDHEGGYWFTTLEKGVFYVPDISILQFSQKAGISDIAANVICRGDKDEIFVGLQNGSVCSINANNFEMEGICKIGSDNKTFQVLDLVFDSPSILWAGTVGDITGTKCTKQKIRNTEIIPLPSPKLVIGKEGIWGGSSLGICRFKDQRLVFNSAEMTDIVKVNCFVHDTLDKFWAGNKKGLWRFESGKFAYAGGRHPLLQYGINDMVKTSFGLLLATEGAGVVIMREDTVFNIFHNDGLHQESINAVHVTPDKEIWLATQQGISSVVLKEGNNSVKDISALYGISSHEVSDVLLYGDDIFFTDKNGFKIIRNFKAEKYPAEIPVFITDVQINHKDTAIHNNYELTYEMNSIGFNFRAISFKYGKVLEYLYRINGLDSAWYHTKNQSVHYASLPAGKYTFEVKVADSPAFTHKGASIDFVIHPPFYKTWWFLCLAIAGIIALVSLLIYLRIRQIVNRAKLLQSLNASQHKALSAQMNPHFIYNSLNSIHTYILQNKSEDSSRYLTRFSKLMRLVLENSAESMITIEKELKALELYLELEIMRFKGKISYKINIDKNLDISYARIPPLLLQPYVENAIWHGLMHKDGDGMIWINLKKDADVFTCTIEDDGIGRKLSSQLKKIEKAEKKSFGTNITAQRVALINSVHNIHIGVTIEDLEDDRGIAKGTRVSIAMPVIG